MRIVKRRQITRKEPKINVDLWPSSAWARKELRQFVDVLEEFGPTSGQISSDIRGIEIQIGIAFAAGAIAGGFFNKLGSDLYEVLKNRLKELLLKRKSKTGMAVQRPEIEGRLSFSYREPEIGFYDVYYSCLYSNEVELDMIFSSLHQIDTLVRRARNSRVFPFDKGQNYDIYGELKISPQSNWNVRVRRYVEENGSLTLDEFFRANLRVEDLESLNVKQIEWI